MRAASSTLPLALLALFALLAASSSALAAREAVIELHMGYGTPSGFVVTGRVIDDKGVRLPAVHRTALDNLVDSLKVLDSDEVEKAVVELEVAGLTFRTRTDDDGNFEVDAKAPPRRLPLGDVPLRARLVEGQRWRAREVTSAVRILPDDAEHVAVLSDFDDTVVESGATNKLVIGMRSVFRNAAQLKPVPGVATAYQRALDAGAAGLFYLSGSPLFFHPRVMFFLEKNGIPTGPLLLKDFGQDSMFQQQAYKRRRLERLLAVLPMTRFILVGDSGEQDPEIYASLREDHPERVAAIIIRRVKNDASPKERFRDMTVVDDYAGDPDVVARHARRALEEIEAARAPAPSGARPSPEDDSQADSEREVDAEVEGAQEVDVRSLGVDAAHPHAGAAEERLPHAEGETRP